MGIVKHTFDGAKNAQPVVVKMKEDGTVLTKLEGLKSPPFIDCRTPVVEIVRAFASRERMAKNPDLSRASQFFEFLATEDSLELLDLREEWAKYVYKHGCMKTDPRFKQILKMQKTMSESDFVEKFKDEMLPGPGSPYYTSCAKRDETDRTMSFRKKPWERVWNDDDSTTFPHDDFIPDVDKLKSAVDYRCKIVPVDVMYKGKSVVDEEYEDLVDKVKYAYFNFTIKLVWSDTNKTSTMMVTPTQMIIGALGPARSGGSAASEKPVDIFASVNSESNEGKRKISSSVDIMDVLSASAPSKKIKE